MLWHSGLDRWARSLEDRGHRWAIFAVVAAIAIALGAFGFYARQTTRTGAQVTTSASVVWWILGGLFFTGGLCVVFLPPFWLKSHPPEGGTFVPPPALTNPAEVNQPEEVGGIADGGEYIDATPALPQERFASEGATNALEVFLETEVPHPFDYKALILEVQFTVLNNTNRQVKLTGLSWMIPDPPWSEPVTDIDCLRKRFELEKFRSKLPGLIEAHDHVRAWTSHVFPHIAEGGEPGYEIRVSDEWGHEYGFRRPSRPQ
jgi:hypothetical protein